MPSATAHIPTDRARRYLTQLGKHGSQMSLRAFHQSRRHNGGEGPPKVVHAEWSDTDAVIDFGWGHCTLRATDTALILHAQAADTQHLQRLQNGIGARLERIGRRDQLTVTWQQTPTPPPDQATSTPAPSQTTPPRRNLTTVASTAVIALAVALHLGLGAALLPRAHWTGPAIDIANADSTASRTPDGQPSKSGPGPSRPHRVEAESTDRDSPRT